MKSAWFSDGNFHMAIVTVGDFKVAKSIVPMNVKSQWNSIKVQLID